MQARLACQFMTTPLSSSKAGPVAKHTDTTRNTVTANMLILSEVTSEGQKEVLREEVHLM